MIVYTKNDTLIELVGARDAATGDWINDAAVAVTVCDAAGAPIAGQAWPVAMDHVPGSAGDYRGVLDAALPLQAGQRYIAEIALTTPAGGDAFWSVPFAARRRES